VLIDFTSEDDLRKILEVLNKQGVFSLEKSSEQTHSTGASTELSRMSSEQVSREEGGLPETAADDEDNNVYSIGNFSV